MLQNSYTHTEDADICIVLEASAWCLCRSSIHFLLQIAPWFHSGGTTSLIWDTIWWDLSQGAHNPLLKTRSESYAVFHFSVPQVDYLQVPRPNLPLHFFESLRSGSQSVVLKGIYYKWSKCSSCNLHTTFRVLTWIIRLHDLGASRWYFAFLVNKSLPLSSQLTWVLYQYKRKTNIGVEPCGEHWSTCSCLALRVILTCCSALSFLDWRQAEVQRHVTACRIYTAWRQ